jgi:predicted metal-binding protein
MRLPVQVKVKQITKEALFRAYKSEEVITYCQRCSNYEKNYSCPDFPFQATEYLKAYPYATVILTEIDTTELQNLLDHLEERPFDSSVLRSYIKSNKQEIPLSSKISMYAFETIKDQMADQLLAAEKEIEGSLGLPPGCCTRCERCLKTMGQGCRYPQKLRYSLEALGFLVSVIYRDCFDMELGWAKDQLPKRFCTCSVLMTREKIKEDLIIKNLAPMTLRIPVNGN